MAKSPASRNDPASSGTSGEVANVKPAFQQPIYPSDNLGPQNQDPSVNQTPYSSPTTAASTGSGGGSGDSTPTPGVDPTTFAADWYKSFFAQYGLPADAQASIINILKQYASDPTTAQTLAQQYLRGTDWFATTFPGFSSGVTNGLFTDETGYRSYLNSVNGLYNQYTGRHVSGDEVTALLQEGANPQLLANRFQGQAWVGAHSNEVQQASGAFGDGQLTPDQLTALGNENAGIDTEQGQKLQTMLAKAQQRAQTVFQGVLGTPNLKLGSNGLSAPGLLGAQQTPDVAA